MCQDGCCGCRVFACRRSPAGFRRRLLRGWPRGRGGAGHEPVWASAALWRAVQVEENLYPAFCEQLLVVQQIGHAAAASGSPIRRGWATSGRDSSEHVLVQQILQETGK